MREDRNNYVNGGINEFEKKVLDLIKENPNVTNDSLVNITGKSSRSIDRVLASLKSKKLIEREGSKKRVIGK